MKKFQVTADVNSEKYGKGQLLANLDETAFIEYSSLSDDQKLAFLKKNGAQFVRDVADLSEADVQNYAIKDQTASSENVPNATTSTELTTPQVSRKMRLNINGNDTGWLDVTDENEAQYEDMLKRFNEAQTEMRKSFTEIFGNFFLN